MIFLSHCVKVIVNWVSFAFLESMSTYLMNMHEIIVQMQIHVLCKLMQTYHSLPADLH